jgi:hypothetical protein
MNEGGFLPLCSMITLVQLSLVISHSPSSKSREQRRRVRMRKAPALERNLRKYFNRRHIYFSLFHAAEKYAAECWGR